MIEKIDPIDIVSREKLVSKINEMIDGCNELHKKLDSLEAVIDTDTGIVNWRVRSDIFWNFQKGEKIDRET